MKNKFKNATYKELSVLIISAIEEEQFFNKETLVPKVKAILNGFGANLNIANYEKVKNPSDWAKYLKNMEQQKTEKKFWRDIVLSHFPNEMSEHYSNLDRILKGLLTSEPEAHGCDATKLNQGGNPDNQKS